MKVYLCKWPNGTISVLTANSKRELYLLLDGEGDPEQANVYKLPSGFHISTEVINRKISVDMCGSFEEAKWRKVKF
jgi:hypothetical protein